MSVGNVIVFGFLSAFLAVWPIVIVYSRFRPDSKPPIGTFESFAGRIEEGGEEHGGRLKILDGSLTFIPHEGNYSLSVAVVDLSSAEFPWGSREFAVVSETARWAFTCFKYPLVAHALDEVRHAERLRKEWKRQLRAAGIRIDPEASWRQPVAPSKDVPSSPS